MSDSNYLDLGIGAKERGSLYDISSKKLVTDVSEREYIVDNYLGLTAKKSDKVLFDNVVQNIVMRYMPTTIAELISDIRRKMRSFSSSPFRYYYVLDSGSVVAFSSGAKDFYFDRDYGLAISNEFKRFYPTILARILIELGDSDLYPTLGEDKSKPDYIPSPVFIADEKKISDIKRRLRTLVNKGNPELFYNIITNEFVEPKEGDEIFDSMSIIAPPEDVRALEIVNDVLMKDEEISEIMSDYLIDRNVKKYEEGKQIFDEELWRTRLEELIKKEKGYYYNPVEDIFVKKSDNTEDKYNFYEEFSLAYPIDVVKDIGVINKDITFLTTDLSDIIPSLVEYGEKPKE